MKNQKTTFFLNIFFLFLSFNVKAQQSTLSGAIVIGNSEVMSYKITYQLSKQNVLTGYSVCDVNGKVETMASITGIYNPKSKVLSFEEKKILSTKSKLPEDEFCLMKVTGKFEMKAGELIYTGKFESAGRNPEISCDSGTVVLLTEKTLDKLEKKTAKILEKVPLPDSLIEESEYTPLLPLLTKNVIELGPGDVKNFELEVDEFQIDLIDDKFRDGDKITLLRNNATVVSRLEITNQVKSFRFRLGKDEKDVTFTIIAEDEGSIALTTVKASLIYGNEVNMLMISLNKGESVKLVLSRKRE
jgi:hypothetical protein